MMMSYQLKLSAKDMKVARLISRLAKLIQVELVDSGMTQQEVARKIGVDRSVVNRRLSGSANLTARSIAEFAYAFDKDIEIKFSGEREKLKFANAYSSNDARRTLPRSRIEQEVKGSNEFSDGFRLEKVSA